MAPIFSGADAIFPSRAHLTFPVPQHPAMHLYLLRLPSLTPHLRQDHPRKVRHPLARRRITALILALLPANPRAPPARAGGAAGRRATHQPIPLLFHPPVPLLPVCLPLQCPCTQNAGSRFFFAFFLLRHRGF